MTKNVKNAILVGVQLPKTSAQELESSLQELARLVNTLGYQVAGRITQKRSSDRSTSILGKGKLVELAEWTGGSGEIASMVKRKINKAAVKRQQQEVSDETEDDVPSALTEDQKGSAQIVIVDIDLSPSQIRNLESASGVVVLDRTGVIIEIFGRHARTRAAKLQVEIARLTYMAPRLRESRSGEDRGGVGGAGESSLELDKRKIRDRIKALKIELASVGDEHEIRRARREKETTVALVGYTNAGKSSLMRAMTGSEVLVADKLFATLDTTIRPLYPETKPKVLLSDTVGFIKKLPHDLVASFKSTLDEALHASLILFVVDASDAAFRSQMEVTQKVLSEVGADAIPSLTLFNKSDCLNDSQKTALQEEFPNAILISTRSKSDLKSLRSTIMSYFEEDMVDEDIFIPFKASKMIGEVRTKARVLSESYDEKGVTLKVRSSPKVLASFRKKL